MSIEVSGKLSFSNGQPPFISLDSSGVVFVGSDQKPFHCKILGESILLEFPEGLSFSTIDDIFRHSRDIVGSGILIKVLETGIGMQYTLNFCKTPDGVIHQAQFDHAPDTGIPSIRDDKLFSIIGANSDMHWAIRDFNQGLLDRENCPVLFYKAIESAVRAILLLTPDAEVNKKEWESFHKKLSTNKEDMKMLYSINESHRHGNHIFFNKDQHLEMMKSTKYFLQKTAMYLTTLKDK